MIKLDNIMKVYKNGECETHALEAVSLSIKRGEYVAVVGSSGSGKSTLLNILGCMDRATDGQYYYDDVCISKYDRGKMDAFRKQHVSFVFQDFALLSHYTVYENVEIPLLAKNLKREERKKRILKNLEWMGIADIKDKYTNQISGGQQQRCAIARALAADNELLLADEPTGALDKKTGLEIIGVLEQIHQEGRTVILVTHDENIAKRTERIIRLEDGRIVSDSASRQDLTI